MSSDGKPLWGFRKLFFLLGACYSIAVVWLGIDLITAGPRGAKSHAPGPADYVFPVTIIAACALLGAGHFWFWLQLRHGQFTPRNWVIGLLLLLPSLIFPPLGILCLISWCARTCKVHFYNRDKILAGQVITSESAPLWGFKIMFCALGVLLGLCAVWGAVDLVNPDPRFAEVNRPGSLNHVVYIAMTFVCALFSAGEFWFWRQLHYGRFTPRNWVIGLILLLPTIVVPPIAYVAVACWSINSCRSLFYALHQIPSPSSEAAGSASRQG